MMVESVFTNSGRGCINASGIWASRHTREIADAHRAAVGRDTTAASGGSGGEPGRLHRPGVAEAISTVD